MKKVISAAIALTLACPMAALAAGKMTKEELIAYATERKACGEERTVVDAFYKDETGKRIGVTCEDATGFVPAVGALGLGGGAAAAAAGVGLLAIAGGGGGGSTPDTQ